MTKPATPAAAAAAAPKRRREFGGGGAREVIERGTYERRNPAGSAPPAGCFRAISFNVNGLRAVLKRPEPLVAMVDAERPHALCLQETKVRNRS